MKLSLKSTVIAGALLKGICFIFVSLMNIILPPYGGAYLSMLMSLYPGYDPVTLPVSIILGTLYSLIGGALAGLLFGSIYNFFAEKS